MSQRKKSDGEGRQLSPEQAAAAAMVAEAKARTALRHLFNRMLEQLHHCLQTGQTYDSIKAFEPAAERPLTTAA